MSKTKQAGLFLILAILTIIVAIVAFNPAKRVETLLMALAETNAPKGTAIGTIKYRFPSRIAVADVSIPVRVRDGERRLLLENLDGRVSLLPLLRRNLHATVETDFFGGTLWVQIRPEGSLLISANGSQSVAIDARARNMDVSEVCAFFRTPTLVTGLCGIDVEGEIDGPGTENFTGTALAVGENIDVPPIAMEKVVLPENHRATIRAQASAERGKIIISDFHLEGTGYDLAGTGEVLLEKPVASSPVKGAVSVILKERLIIKDEELRRSGAESFADVLIDTRSKVFFTVKGTVEEPVIKLDSASSLGTLLQHFNR